MKGRKNKEAAASTSHQISPTKAKKGRKRKSSLVASSSNSSFQEFEFPAEKNKRSSFSETPSSPTPGVSIMSSSPGAQSPSLYTPPLLPLYRRVHIFRPLKKYYRVHSHYINRVSFQDRLFHYRFNGNQL